ncbi:MAG: histidine phosphatase family protein [Chitinophagales bacterium]
MKTEFTNGLVFFISHANVFIDPKTPVPQWGLSEKGKQQHRKFNTNDAVKNIQHIYCSNEQKSIDGAMILAQSLNLSFHQEESLGEMDRSSTGYLKEAEFQKTVNDFFANPELSIRGWEKAVDAQKRIIDTIKKIISKESNQDNIAIVSHGGVGALTLAYLLGENISRKFDQPFNGGGNYFCFDKKTLKVIHGWRDISG